MRLSEKTSAKRMTVGIFTDVIALLSSAAVSYYGLFFDVSINSSLYLVLWILTLLCVRGLKKSDLSPGGGRSDCLLAVLFPDDAGGTACGK